MSDDSAGFQIAAHEACGVCPRRIVPAVKLAGSVPAESAPQRPDGVCPRSAVPAASQSKQACGVCPRSAVPAAPMGSVPAAPQSEPLLRRHSGSKGRPGVRRGFGGAALVSRICGACPSLWHDHSMVGRALVEPRWGGRGAFSRPSRQGRGRKSPGLRRWRPPKETNPECSRPKPPKEPAKGRNLRPHG